jgi:subtilisin
LGRRASASAPGGGKGKKPPKEDETAPPQVRPWGIDRCYGGLTANTGDGIKVAVIDSGCDLDHSDLAANIKGNVDFTGSRRGAEDEHGHGTHVAGTIAGLDNSIGVIGMAPTAHIYVVRVLNRRGSGTWAGVANGISWAADNGCQIANMSLGGGSSSTVQNACSYAEGKGVLLCAAAGNSGDGNSNDTELSYPAAYSTVVSVAAIAKGDGLASFSNSGDHVELAAPGVGVTSTFKSNGYETWNGTSMACPHVAGVAALIWSEFGSTDNDAVRAELRLRVDDRGPTGRDRGYGFGVSDYGS